MRPFGKAWSRIGEVGGVARIWKQQYLLEVWIERRVVDSLPMLVRGRLRNLTRESETYVGSMAQVEAVVEDDLEALGARPRIWERDRDV